MAKVSRLGSALGVTLGLCFVASAARAEGPPPAGAAPASTAGANGVVAADTDVVRLKNGGLVRGRISELLPGDSVTIVTIAGKTHEFKMSEVTYAGPAASDPQQPSAATPPAAAPVVSEPKATETTTSGNTAGPKPYVTVHGREARLHLVADESGITFHRQTGSAMAVGAGGVAFATGYERMCTAPCDVSLPAGTETLALSRENKPPIAADPVTLPPGASEVHGSVESRAGIRTAGVVIALGAAVVGSVLAVTSSGSHQTCDTFGGCYDTTDLNMGQLIAGVVIVGVGAGVGIGMVFVPDKATIQVNPSNSASLHPTSLARAVTLSGHF